MKSVLTSILFLILCITLTGCYDMKEIDETAYIVALGIDNAENGNFSYTFQFSAPLAITNSENSTENQSSGESAPDGNKTVTNLTVTAPDFYTARNMTNNFMSKNLNMSHLKMIVFAYEVPAENIEHHSQLLLHEREIRPHTAIAVSQSSAKKFLENVNPELESNTSKYYELMSLQSNNVYAPTKKLHDFVDDLTTDKCDTVLPLATEGKKIPNMSSDHPKGWISAQSSSVESQNSLLYGMAIFKNSQLSSIADGDSAMMFNILNKNIDNCNITLEDKHNPDRTLSFRISIPEKADYSINRKTNTIGISQELRAEFLGSILPDGYKSFDELYSDVQNIITNRIQIFLYDVSRNKSADILGLRNEIRSQFLTWQDWESFDWKNFYANANFSVNITVAKA